MLKRKLYWLAIGMAASNLLIAKNWDSRTPGKFGGDCPDCYLPQPSAPLKEMNSQFGKFMEDVKGKLGGSDVTGFTHGNALGGVPDKRLSDYSLVRGYWDQIAVDQAKQLVEDQQNAAKQAKLIADIQAQLSPQPAPFVVPPQMRLIPTQSEYLRIMPSSWLDAIASKTYYNPVPSSAGYQTGYFSGALPYWGSMAPRML